MLVFGVLSPGDWFKKLMMSLLALSLTLDPLTKTTATVKTVFTIVYHDPNPTGAFVFPEIIGINVERWNRILITSVLVKWLYN